MADIHETRDQVPLSANEMLFIALCAVFVVTLCLTLGLMALRVDRPAVCDPYPTYAECSAAVAEGR